MGSNGIQWDLRSPHLGFLKSHIEIASAAFYDSARAIPGATLALEGFCWLSAGRGAAPFNVGCLVVMPCAFQG